MHISDLFTLTHDGQDPPMMPTSSFVPKSELIGSLDVSMATGFSVIPG